MNAVVEILAAERLAPFEFRWPEGTEVFENGWSLQIRANGERHTARHGLGAREVYGRLRVHTVTWIDGEVQVEGVEADDYPVTQALISRLRRSGRAVARTWDEVPRTASRSRYAKMTLPHGRGTPGYAASSLGSHRGQRGPLAVRSQPY